MPPTLGAIGAGSRRAHLCAHLSFEDSSFLSRPSTPSTLRALLLKAKLLSIQNWFQQDSPKVGCPARRSLGADLRSMNSEYPKMDSPDRQPNFGPSSARLNFEPTSPFLGTLHSIHFWFQHEFRNPLIFSYIVEGIVICVAAIILCDSI